MLKTITIAIALMFSTTAYAQDFSPKEPRKAEKWPDFSIIPNAKKSVFDAPDVRFPSPSVLVNTCGDYLLSVDIGAIHGVDSVTFMVESFAASQIIYVTGPPWEENWVMPCNEVNNHNYSIRAIVLDTRGAYSVATFWVFLR